MLTIYCQNNQTKREVEHGTTLAELVEIENVKLEYPLLGALVNNKVRDISYKLSKPAIISFFDMTSTCGSDMYKRSVYFLLSNAVCDTYPGAKLKVSHSISGGKYCELEDFPEPLTQEVVDRINQRMQELIAEDLPFEREEMLTPDALNEFAKHGLTKKVELLKDRKRIFTSVYKLGNHINYFYGFLIPSTGYVKLYSLELYETGLLLKLPSKRHPTQIATTRKLPKLFAVYQTHKKWVQKIGVPYVSDLNEKISNNEIEDFIKISEAFHEKLIAGIADEINKRENVKLILLSGPSSSGKTTTCKRLSVQLGVLGYKTVQVSVDDFFVEREDTPKDAEGNYNFETLDAIDLPLFNKTIKLLLEGNEVELPTFNFNLGKKEWKGKKIKLSDNALLVIEGIHCLNPRLTEQIDDSIKYKIFVSALTSISIDAQNPIPTTDNRLIRRITRDYRYRGYSALDTLRRWQSVRDGEARNIFPFQENADIMFNTSLLCELGVLKLYAVPILNEVPETEVEYAEATRLLKFLSYFKTIPEKSIPGGSILREFVGGSNFHY
jgi:uridine kinase